MTPKTDELEEYYTKPKELVEHARKYRELLPLLEELCKLSEAIKGAEEALKTAKEKRLGLAIRMSEDTLHGLKHELAEKLANITNEISKILGD